MVWVIRGGHRYYYRSLRSGKRTRKEYVGCDEVALAQYLEDHQKRIEQQAQLNRERALCDKLNLIDARIEQISQIADMFAHIALLQSGYHKPGRGKWRKRRVLKRPADSS